MPLLMDLSRIRAATEIIVFLLATWRRPSLHMVFLGGYWRYMGSSQSLDLERPWTVRGRNLKMDWIVRLDTLWRIRKSLYKIEMRVPFPRGNLGRLAGPYCDYSQQ